ncbi:3'-phosphoadenosine 5'-phosphosulfate (PAPS) 3'-phosphatase [Cenarchaeum symbiosum A]|uniref:3'-phosphoadenosine 5'-phosphosulfate (PAPS) 3'-phosphatase n=1 Tax=Cenarchaeum symbiosum (strain A) TaxID=414004 RepID=A0RYS3_CENSY|nr:3'-phosphoadenosine 5'-phosphosulfate (PAPS) 3'-phosphatase [Cenarchaeum symbiosum A]
MITPPVRGGMPELGRALEAAERAGRAVMDVYRTEFEHDTKADGSPVTGADLASNQVIREMLEGSGHRILSEEDADDGSRLGERTLWIVDPLDGTSDFVDRTGEFTVMIALVRDGRPILGVIGWPDGGELYAAQKGAGAFRYSGGRWEGIRASDAGEIGRSKAVGSRHHLSEREKEAMARLGVGSFEGVGSSLKACRIACGEADLYFTYTDKMCEWDSAASSCIVAEAGGDDHRYKRRHDHVQPQRCEASGRDGHEQRRPA